MSKRLDVPLPFRDRIEAYGDLTYSQVHEAVSGSRVREVPLSILTSTQKTVGEPRLAMYEAGKVRKRPGDEPIVIAHGDKLYIHNGHHRSTAALRSGQRTLRARVAGIGDRPARLFGHAGQLLMMSERATSVEYREHDVEDVATVLDGGVAVICIDTPLESKPGAGWWNYFDDYESIYCRFANALKCDEVKSVLLKIDSPGGAAAGLNECVDAMRRLKKRIGKPVVAYADEGAYSAAYALACVADQIYLPKAGGLGSVGVISQIVSFDEANKKDGIKVVVVKSGARKDDAHPDVPVTDKAVAHLQRRVDQLAKIYFKLVAKVRGVDARPLEADTFYGRDAVRKGLADEVMTLEEVLEKMGLDKAGSGKSTSTGKKRDSKVSDDMSIQKAKAALDAAIKAGDKAGIEVASAALDKQIAAGKKIVTTETRSTESSKSSESQSESSGASEVSGSEEESMPTAEESHSGSSMSSMASSGSSGSSGSSEEEEEEEEEEKYAEEEEHAAKQFARHAVSTLGLSKSARSGLAREFRAVLGPLLKSAARATGKRGLSAIRGALDAMPSQRAHTKHLAKEVASLKQDKVRTEVDRYIAKAVKSGKVTPAERESLRAAGLKDPKWLKANLAARPRVMTVKGSEDLPRDGKGGAPSNDEQAAMLAAATAGMSESDRKAFEEGHSARQSKSNGHPTH